MEDVNIMTNKLDSIQTDLYSQVKDLIVQAREQVIRTVNSTLVSTYWQIGKLIVEKQGGVDKAKYGDRLIEVLSMDLSSEFGAGFSKSNLKNIRNFYLSFQKSQTLSVQLTWSHYLELIKEFNETVKTWYLKESVKSNWTIRQLRKGTYYRVLEHKTQIQGENDLTKIADTNPKRILKDPYYLDFLGINPNMTDVHEKDIEQALMTHLTQFLLELGRGFTFVSRQKRMLIDGDEFFIDLVFYNIKLNCYVLIDLKRGKLSHQDIGQMLTYVGYFDYEVKEPNQHPTIGLILSESKNDTAVKYALSGTAKPIFASIYELILPSESELKEIVNAQRSSLESNKY